MEFQGPPPRPQFHFKGAGDVQRKPLLNRISVHLSLVGLKGNLSLLDMSSHFLQRA